MTRRRRTTPKHCLHKPTGQGYVRLDGKCHYTGTHGTPEAEQRYERLLAEWFANGRTLPPPPEVGGMLVEDLMAKFGLWAQKYYRKNGEPTGEFDNIRDALRPLRKLYGLLPVEDFGPRCLKAYRDALIRGGLARTTINSRVNIIKRMFSWGAEEECVPGEVAAALRAVRGLRKGRSDARETAPVESVPEAHFRAVLPFLGRPVRAMAELQWLTGMRPGEVLQMRWQDIEQGGKVWIYRPGTHKTEHHGKGREVPLGPKAQGVLKGFLRLNPAAPLFSPADAMQEHRAALSAARRTPVPPSQVKRAERARSHPRQALGETYTVHSYRRAIARACDQAGVPRWTPNRLRHSAATRIRKEFGLDAARALLGHSTVVTTEVYAELDRVQAAKIMLHCG